MRSDRFSFIADIWSRDRSQYPQGGAVPGLSGLCLRIKCTICILLGREGDPYENTYHDAVHVGPMCVGHSWDGPTCDWWETSVGIGWRHWRYYRYRNGI